MRRILVSGVVALAAIGLLGACGGSDSKTIKTKEGEVKVSGDKNSGKVTIKTKDGSASFGAGTSLPDDFPKDDVPLPKGGKVTGYISGGDSGKQGWTLTVDVSDVKSAAKSYKTQLEDADYTIEDGLSVGSGDGSFESYTAKGDMWDVSVIASKDAKSGEDALLVSVQSHDEHDTTSTT